MNRMQSITWVSKWGRLAALGAGVFLSFASNSPAGGDRTGGECPAGETCSPDTPNGLYFGGAQLGDAVFASVVAPQRLATGGKQTIAVFTDADAAHEFVGFEALAAGPSFQVLAVAGNQVSLAGAATGTDFLRLVDPQNDELYDRIALQTADVDSMAVVPLKLDVLGDKELYDAARPQVVFHTGRSEGRFAVALFDAAGVRVVDESLTLQLGAGFTRDVTQWDRFQQSDAALPAGSYNLGLTLGSGNTGQLGVTLVDSVDAIKWVPGEGADEGAALDTGTAEGQVARFCFRAENGGRPVVGATFAYSATAQLEITSPPGSCVNLKGVTAGLATLTVTVDGVAQPFDVPVTTQTASARAADVRASRFEPAVRAGERAAALISDDAR